ncbi:hypothetical protein N180_07910 [Pedobacter antarcticus 4BY]|uniref:ABC transporter domain-containing protein n=2 Tax=Pedobacter antarcticus TaxID=34086 RepID=A0A081PL28_9SPHI|nr:ATP-binding cassette domain-containing protein [Pedobacter antarcticus]KEQ31401.1 hypothetical protein N180_07910 [Pedobacter antarcticus 4BY]SFE39402.1 ABC-type multidrug transport system, ATPase component [Pedobacter antarcticus]
MRDTLEADSIVFEVGRRRILSDIYIKIETGRITGLLGRNGQGKSTLMKILFGTLTPMTKSIRVNGHYIHKPYLERGLISYLPQFNCVPADRKIIDLFKDFELDYDVFVSRFSHIASGSNLKFRQLSGGSRRFIETYLLLFTPGSFALLDEPFSHLSPVIIQEMSLLIREASKQKGILITDHYYEETLRISDQLYILQNGKIKPVQSSEELDASGYLPLSCSSITVFKSSS